MSLSLLRLLLSSLLLSLSLSSPTPESDILLQLKSYWADPPSLSSWAGPTSPCLNWAGVVCRNGAVTELNLPNHNLSPAVPPAVCQLSNLSSLNLSNNLLSGPLPLCPNLNRLNLSQNLFNGPIPRHVSLLSALHVLDLSGNNFSGNIPSELTGIFSLRQLFLDNNLLTSVPSSLFNLTALTDLSLAYNPFGTWEVPCEIGRLRELRFLWASNANLIGPIPLEIGNLTALEFLQLSSNGLNGPVPGALWALPKLKFLYLFDNSLSGEIPAEIPISPALEEIDLSMNNFSGKIPKNLTKNPNLRILFLYRNSLSGEIPPEMAAAPRIRDVRLFENNLTGEIPFNLGRFSEIENLELWGNLLSGEIPPHLCAGAKLESLILHTNRFTGRLPAELGRCKSLKMLRLSKNAFSGEFPRTVWLLENLTAVLVSENAFSGKIPERLPDSLARIEIEGNEFSGGLPTEAAGLKVFRASRNAFSGSVSGVVTGLEELVLDGNCLTGSLPAGIKSLRSLTVLNLRRNRIIGEIPVEIGDLPVLSYLDLSDNRLSGEVPPSMVGLKLSFLNLSGNCLSGDVPNFPYVSSCMQNHASNRRAVPFICIATFLVLVLVLVLVLGYRRRRSKEDGAVTWKMMHFQPLNFSEREIIKGIARSEMIGAGGGGDVYRVDVGGGRTVAVKQLRRTVTGEKAFAEEVKILATARHVNVTKLLCAIAGDDEKLLVFEFMENGTVEDMLHGERWREFGWKERLVAATGAARGLCYLHHDCSPPIIHRDVKSGNILLDREFQAKLADFGVARVAGGTASAAVYSVGYAAPEVGYNGGANEKADVYGFGVVLLELTTGRTAAGLAEWAWRRFEEGEGVLDRRVVKEGWEEEEMEVVHRVGLACTAARPEMRPAMTEVVQALSTLCQRRHRVGNKTREDDDAASNV